MSLFTYKLNSLETSAWTDYPTRYKFIGVEILLNFDLNAYSRNTYSLLQWFGDLGGLNEALQFMGSVMVSGFASFNSGSFLISRLFIQSNLKYRKSRSIIKKKISLLTKDEENTKGSIFKKL